MNTIIHRILHLLHLDAFCCGSIKLIKVDGYKDQMCFICKCGFIKEILNKKDL